MKLKMIATLVLLLLVMMFAVQNAAMVEIKLLFWQFALPRWLLIFTVLVIGIVIGWFYRSIVKLADISDYRKKSSNDTEQA